MVELFIPAMLRPNWSGGILLQCKNILQKIQVPGNFFKNKKYFAKKFQVPADKRNLVCVCECEAYWRGQPLNGVA